MKKILILGAYGKTAQIVTERILKETKYELKLFLRNTARLDKYKNHQRVELIEGDANSVDDLSIAMNDVDIVYSNLGGTTLDQYTKNIIEAMYNTGKSRLIFYSALGTRYEVPGEFGKWNEKAIASYLPGFRKSSKLLDDAKNINVTELRPAWLTDNDEIDYEITYKNTPFKGTEISRKSVADIIVKIITDPTQYQNNSIGINKPNTNGNKPSWM